MFLLYQTFIVLLHCTDVVKIRYAGAASQSRQWIAKLSVTK